MNNERCEVCRFAAKSETEMGTFLCTRYPPVPILVPVQNMQGPGISVQFISPHMKGGANCGEFSSVSPAENYIATMKGSLT